MKTHKQKKSYKPVNLSDQKSQATAQKSPKCKFMW